MNAITVPGREPFIVAGPIMAAVKGIEDSSRGLAAAMAWLGIPDSDAQKYQARIKSGEILLSLQCETPTCADKAKVLLVSTGAEEIFSTNDPKPNLDGTDRPRRRATSG